MGFRRAFRLAIWSSARADLEEEFAFHLEMRAAELMARGWEPDAARAEARRQFGDLEAARAYCRTTDQRLRKRTMRTEWLQEFRQDLLFALRGLRKAPGFALVAALTLALGIGANTAIFSVVRGILLRPLPFADPGRLVMVASTYQGQRSTSSPANSYDWRDQNHSFSGISVIGSHSAVLTGSGEPERLRGFDVGANFFSILGVKAIAGRADFLPEEAAWKGPRAVVLSETVWRNRFGSDPRLVGSMISLDNERVQVVGVVPAASTWPSNAVMWFPFTMEPERLARSRGAVYLSNLARLKPGVTVASATLDMQAIARRLETAYPDVNKDVSAVVIPMREWITGGLDTPLYVLLGGVAFVLLIACANVANLLLVRGVAREGELAVRTALGAARGRLVRQLVTESLVLALIGGAAGLALAVGGTRLLVGAAPRSIPRLDAIKVDLLVLGFTVAIVLVTGILFGLLPARQVVRPDLAKTLREGGRDGGQRAGGSRARRALVIAEVALSVMLLAGAGLLIRSFDRLMHVDPGFRSENSISFALSLPDAKYGKPEQQIAFFDAALARIHDLPGVESVGAGFGMPLTSFGFSFSFEVTGRAPLPPSDQPVAEVRVATPDYFKAMAIPVVKGRGFTATDRAGAVKVMLITQTAATKFFPGEDPLGKHVTFGWGQDGQTLEGDIIGIVADVKQSSLAQTTLPQFWAPYQQWPLSSMNVVMHTTREPMAVVADARRIIHELDPDLAVAQVKTLDEIVAESVAQPRFYMMLLTAFAVIAILLSAIGIYGVIAYLVGQRSREIGVRIALGASRSNVVRLIVKEAVLMAAGGIGIGLLGALALTRLMGALLFDLKSTDPVTYLAVTGVLGGVALLAASLPALRASRIDPALAMRGE
ncbi:MAG TPA: ABC transporter permease [Gemmatimonadales bacterium]|jgi:predicted permease|nr:ABC transporter permease [Gemmatimonadales bacterium]